MKLLLLILILLFSFSSFAGYVKESELQKSCDQVRHFKSNKKDCVGKCYSITKDYKCKTHSFYPIMVNDLENPNWGTRSMIENCFNETDCKNKIKTHACIDDRHAIYGLMQTEPGDEWEYWCNKILDYPQIDSGLKELKEDPIKKAAYLAGKKAIKDAEKEEKDLIKSLKDKTGDLTNLEIKQMFQYLLKNLK